MLLQTVIETPTFIKQINECMEHEVYTEFISFIAANPEAGDLISGAGGARKVRWQSNLSSGKRGGARVIYYYHDQDTPIFLLAAYKKNNRENIITSEKQALSKIIKLIVKTYKR